MAHPLPVTLFGVITVIAMLVVFLIFAMKYASAVLQARAALKAQEANSALLADMSTRLAAVEKLLKDVG